MQNAILLVVLALVAAPLVFLLLAIGGIGLWGGGMMGGMMGFPLMGGFFMFAVPALVVALLVALGIVLVRGAMASSPPAPPTRLEAPLDVLKMRFARGEITQEQFAEIRRELDA